MSETIYEVLKAEHREVADILEKLEKTDESDAAERRKLFATLEKELEAHAEAEQKVFYPALLDDETSRDIAQEGKQEHHVVKTLLRELEDVNIEGFDQLIGAAVEVAQLEQALLLLDRQVEGEREQVRQHLVGEGRIVEDLQR